MNIRASAFISNMMISTSENGIPTTAINAARDNECRYLEYASNCSLVDFSKNFFKYLNLIPFPLKEDCNYLLFL